MQGQALRDRADDFRAAGCVVIGASFDTPAENKAFAGGQSFGFRLLSDTTRQVGEAYQVVRPGGERYRDFPRRVSYLIDPTGVIRRSYTVADVAGHAGQVLRDLNGLRALS